MSSEKLRTEKTVDDNSSRFLYDWVSFTSKHDTVEEIIALLGLGSVPWADTYGARGYISRKYYGGISIHYESQNENQFTWCEMSGQGCRTFESYGTGDFDGVFEWIISDESRHLTRLDVAFDDRDDLQVIDLNDFWVALENRDYVSRSGWKREDNSDGAKTIYLGSRSSDQLFRIYDKCIERGLHKKPLDFEGDNYIPPHWVRLELQLRDDYALRFIMADGFIGDKLLGVLKNSWRFVERDYDSDDKDKRRWPLASWWQKLIDGIESVKLYDKPGEEYNFDRTQRFVFQMAGAASLCTLQILGLTRFLAHLQECKDKMLSNPRYVELLKQFNKW